MQSALEMRQRPSAALLNEPDPFSNWTSIDYRLSEALYVMDKEKCPTCGNPVWLCHSANPNIEFELKVGACYGAAEIEDDKDRKLESGEYLYAVAVGIKNEDGTREPLPSRAEALKYMD